MCTANEDLTLPELCSTARHTARFLFKMLSIGSDELAGCGRVVADPDGKIAIGRVSTEKHPRERNFKDFGGFYRVSIQHVSRSRHQNRHLLQVHGQSCKGNAARLSPD